MDVVLMGLGFLIFHLLIASFGNKQTLPRETGGLSTLKFAVLTDRQLSIPKFPETT
jgi:hypothetical protein